jgi:hypothetical protein
MAFVLFFTSVSLLKYFINNGNFTDSITFPLAKFFEITFQQFCLYGIFSHLITKDLYSEIGLLIPSLFFMFFHIPLYFFLDKRYAFIFTLSSFFGFIIFYLIYLNTSLAFHYVFAIHLLFYLFLYFWQFYYNVNTKF